MSKKGFTLVELLVVITIIAILSVVGLTVFQRTQQRARNAKVQQDVQAIINAYEVHYNEMTGTYPAVAASWFSSGVIPTPPRGGAYTGLVGGTGPIQVCGAQEPTGTPNYCLNTQQ